MSRDHVREVRAIDQMDLIDLKAKHQELFGGEEPITRNTKVLREQIKRRLLVLEIDRKKSEIPPGAGKERAAKRSAKGVESMNASATTQISSPALRGISDLQKMSLKELQEMYEMIFGKPTKSRNRKQLFARIAKKVQEGSGEEKPSTSIPKPTVTAKFVPKTKRSRKSTKAGKKAATKKREPKPIGARDPRLPKVGTTITKTYKGETINVRVLEKGFECQGKEFRSLSAVAKHVTGSIWNGFLFFGLVQRGAKKS